MKISFSNLAVGDIFIMAKGSTIVLAKVLKRTASGSIKYSFREPDDEEDSTVPRYEARLELDVEKHNKVMYLKDYYVHSGRTNNHFYESYYWKLGGLNG
jgi:hypothetical protein